jgi:hypothetical protein
MSFKLHQKPITGERFVRCSQVVIDNRFGHLPRVTFHRETVLGLEGGAAMRRPMSPRELAFDPAAAVPVINPETGEQTGQTVTQAELYALVFSVFVAGETAPTDDQMTEGSTP